MSPAAVNVVSPGTVITAGYKSELAMSDEQIEHFTSQIARAVLFRASGDSGYVNGIEPFVDGGMSQI